MVCEDLSDISIWYGMSLSDLVWVRDAGLEQLLPLPDMHYYASAVALCLSSLATFRGVLEKL